MTIKLANSLFSPIKFLCLIQTISIQTISPILMKHLLIPWQIQWSIRRLTWQLMIMIWEPLEADQQYFEDIGSGHYITCREHVCSKFNKPIQYFLMLPSRTLARYENLTIPSIVTLYRSGNYTFKIRVYKSGSYIKHARNHPWKDWPPTYEFNQVLESETVLYLETKHYCTVSFTTVNPLPTTSSFIEISLDSFLTLASDLWSSKCRL